MDVGYQDAIDEDIISDLRNYFPPETPEKDIIGKCVFWYILLFLLRFDCCDLFKLGVELFLNFDF